LNEKSTQGMSCFSSGNRACFSSGLGAGFCYEGAS
jgi:hypothetical protein